MLKSLNIFFFSKCDIFIAKYFYGAYMNSTKKTITFGISSGIAAFKVVEIIKKFDSSRFIKNVILSKNAEYMLDKGLLEGVADNIYSHEVFDENFDYAEVLKKRSVEHINLADETDIFCIAPCTANTIAKISHGIADDLLTTTMLASNAPIILSPSMNTNMWNNPSVQENLLKLAARSQFKIIQPSEGELACGYNGIGRLPELETIQNMIIHTLQFKTKFEGKRVVVTAGGTQEKIDDVRVLTNRSSGKMGGAIALSFAENGADVYLLLAKNSLIKITHPNITVERFESSSDLQNSLVNNLNSCDVLIHSAAVSDYKPLEVVNGKISSKKEELTIKLTQTPKIINEVKSINPNIFLVGFKALSNVNQERLLSASRKVINDSDADLVVANDVGVNIVFSSDQNKIMLVTKNKYEEFDLMLKSDVAQLIVDTVRDIYLTKGNI